MQVFAFQAHEDETIEFDQVTTIVGPSDAGKTSLVRALRWVAHNKPRGDGFVREGAKEGRARVKVDDHVVTRIRRGASKNLYKVDGKELKAFGSDAPQQVEDLFQTDDVNFQLQMDPPFWLSLTPGEAAKELNNVADLGAIDDAMAYVASYLRKAGPKEEAAQESLKKCKENVEALEFVDQFVIELDKVLELDKEREEHRDDAQDFESDYHAMKKTWNESFRLKELVADREKVCEAAKLWGQSKKQADRLESHTAQIVENQDSLIGDLPELPEEEKENFETVRILRQDLEQLINKTGVAIARAAELKKDLGELAAKIEEECEGQCPLCGGELHV